MGRGIAPQFAEAYPELLEADNETTVGDKDKLGHLTGYWGDNIIVCNLYGQYHWSKYKLDYGGNTDYVALEKSLRIFRDILLSSGNNIHSVGLPKITKNRLWVSRRRLECC